MSASLVGSEMCIRDRLVCLPVAFRGATPAMPSRHHPTCLPPSRMQCYHACLLYTSDAADDM
eukprot:11090687-Alexandrium_andersonii.AAC.1